MNRRLFLLALGWTTSGIATVKRLAARPKTARFADAPHEVLRYGVVDSQGDIFAPGCFAAPEGQTFPLSIGFDPHKVIGRAAVYSTEKALFARLDIAAQWADRIGAPFEVAAAFRPTGDTKQYMRGGSRYYSRGVTLLELGICPPQDKIR